MILNRFKFARVQKNIMPPARTAGVILCNCILFSRIKQNI